LNVIVSVVRITTGGGGGGPPFEEPPESRPPEEEEDEAPLDPAGAGLLLDVLLLHAVAETRKTSAMQASLLLMSCS
jgi:hypothetical protein